MSQPLLDGLLSRLGALPEDAHATLRAHVSEATAGRVWFPNPGPQTEAYDSPADVLLYGGQGGGGKTDLGLGLAFTAHERSLILRRKYANLSGLTERALKIHGNREGFNGSPPPLLRAKGRYIQFAGCQHPGDEQDWQGQPFDLKVFDEATQFLETMVRFHLGWLRSTTPGQRTRAVLATNPPIDADGDWIIGWFRPWLDITHPKPAKPGELRWFARAPDGTEVEVEDGRPTLFPGADRPTQPESRTFIPAALADNPDLVGTGYEARLDALPEPIRSAVRDGNFMAARTDAERQIIPTAWVLAAQARWRPDGWRESVMTAIGYDPAGGGADADALAYRHGGWFGEVESIRGAETADGSASAGRIVTRRRNTCGIVVDVGGGYGGDVSRCLKDNGIDIIRFNGAEAAPGTALGSGMRFFNRRTEALWRFREALDPDQEGGSAVALPPDPELRADLTAPTFEPTLRGLKAESKDDIRKRLGRSTNKGDAVVMCLSEGSRAVARAKAGRQPQQATANMGREQMRRRRA